MDIPDPVPPLLLPAVVPSGSLNPVFNVSGLRFTPANERGPIAVAKPPLEAGCPDIPPAPVIEGAEKILCPARPIKSEACPPVVFRTVCPLPSTPCLVSSIPRSTPPIVGGVRSAALAAASASDSRSIVLGGGMSIVTSDASQSMVYCPCQRPLRPPCCPAKIDCGGAAAIEGRAATPGCAAPAGGIIIWRGGAGAPAAISGRGAAA